ncbi:Ig-like domain-containing protein [Paenibacillus sp. FSL W8-0426]|uniref:Ig-like domain-containing protein n=1 Tax=Paenibacillus sp. FSL W8-0426 TaxID=2921714 RepID=UPI0030DCCCF9
MSLKELMQKGMIVLLVVLLAATGWSGIPFGETNRAYAAQDWASAIESIYPAADTTVTDGTAPLKVVFSEEVKKAENPSGKIRIKSYDSNLLIDEVDVNSSEVTFAGTDLPQGKEISIAHDALQTGRYYVEMDDNAFVTVGDTQEGVSGPTGKTWNFSIKVQSTVTATAFSPLKGAVSVPLSSNIQITYSGAISIGTGLIQIYQGSSVSETVNVAAGSPRVTISGNTLMIDPVNNFVNSNTYSVVIPDGAVKDSAGNDIAGIALGGWSFTAFQSDPTAITVSSLSPSNGASNVALTGEFTVTFNKELDPNYQGSVTLKSSNGSVIPTSTVVNASNNRQLRVILLSSLLGNTTYTVDIPGGELRDKSGNLFAGLNGSASWTFRTLSPDRTAPVLKTAKMYSNTIIRLTYDEYLSGTDSFPSSFTVTVNGETRSVNTAYVSGDSVYVVLDTGVAVGQVVRISYTPGTGMRRIQDLSLNPAVGFSLREVENGLDSIMSKPREGTVYNSTITLYYPESVYIASSDAVKQFSVTADGSSVDIASMSGNNGSVVSLNLSRAIQNGEVVQVSYQPGTYPVKDSRGQALAGFSGFYVRNSIDTKPPEFTGAEVSGNKLWMRYNEPLSRTNKPLKSQYSVLADGKAVFVNDSEIEDNVVTLTLASAVTSTQTVTLSYVPGTARLTDLNGNPAGYLNLEPVKYTYGNGMILSASLQGDTIQINFRNAVKTESALTPAQFYVQMGGSAVSVSSASASGSVVTLKLAASASAGQTGTVSYTPGAVPIRDAASNAIAAFGPMSVQQSGSTTTDNPTTVEGRPTWLTEMSAAESGFGQAMYVMKNEMATSQITVSKNSRSTRQYTLDGTKLAQAFSYAASNSKLAQPVVFEVPSSEASAYVGIPFHALSQLVSNYRTGTFGIKYGDSLWVVPLSKLNVSSMGQSAGITTAPGTAILNVQLEALPVLSLGTFEYMLSNSNANRLANVTEVFVSLYNGNTDQNVEQNIKGQFWMQLPGNTSTTLTAFAAIDPATQTLTYVPTTFRSTSAGMVARGQLNGSQVVTPVTHLVSYPNAKSWQREALTELTSKWIISPAAQATLKPDQKITRAEFAELIAKGLGLKGNREAAQKFSDLPGNSTTVAYIGAAAEAEIIGGYQDGTFKPNSLITREQMALMMARAMSYVDQPAELQVSAEDTLSRFKDRKKIVSKDTVARVVQAGIMQGTSDTKFEPQQNATKAEAVLMLKRMLNNIGYM